MVSCRKGEASRSGLGVPARQIPAKGAEPPPCTGRWGSVAAGSAPDFRGGGVGGAALHLGSGAARRPLARLALPQPGMVPAAPLGAGDPAMARADSSCCLWEPRFLSYGRQEVSGEGGRQRQERQAGLRRGRPALPRGAASPAAVPWAVRGRVLHQRFPDTVTELPGFHFPGVRAVSWSPAGGNAERPRPGPKLAQLGCSAALC